MLGQHISMPGLNNGDYICQFNDASHAIDSGGNQTLHTEQLRTWQPSQATARQVNPTDLTRA